MFHNDISVEKFEKKYDTEIRNCLKTISLVISYTNHKSLYTRRAKIDDASNDAMKVWQ